MLVFLNLYFGGESFQSYYNRITDWQYLFVTVLYQYISFFSAGNQKPLQKGMVTFNVLCLTVPYSRTLKMGSSGLFKNTVYNL